MKIKALLFSLAALVMAACAEKEGIDENPVHENSSFTGTVTVKYMGEDVNTDNIVVNITPDEGGKTCSLTIIEVRFVPQMPPIDVTIPGIEIRTTGSGIALSCDNVIPWALGGEYPRYLVTDFQGELKDGKLDFSLNFGSTPTSYSGIAL